MAKVYGLLAWDCSQSPPQSTGGNLHFTSISLTEKLDDLLLAVKRYGLNLELEGVGKKEKEQ